MKLIKQVKLFFQEGTSDKVYEIDLCESGDGYLVNFRYGRRGSVLKEGTKTIFPVPIAEAHRVFDSLEQEKRKKGYVAAGEAAIVTDREPAKKTGTDKRKKTIIKLLKAAAAGEPPEHWPLSRIIWRAGDLMIPEAIPHIIKVADPSDAANIYSVVWSIGRCGTADAMGFLQTIQQRQDLADHVRHLAFEAMWKLAPPDTKEVLFAAVMQSLPKPFQHSITNRDARQLRNDLREYLFRLKTASNDYLVGIYQLTRDDSTLHPVFLEILEDIRFEPNYFKHVRKIFKTAEMLGDYATYGMIAKQFEKQKPAYKASRWMSDDQKKQRAFSDKTKAYLTRRILRQLRKYGEAGEPNYVNLAMEILLAFSDDKDKREPYYTSQYSYRYNEQTRSRNAEETRTHFDEYSSFQVLNFILYHNSNRYRRVNEAFVCLSPYKPGDAIPAEREEAFPHLWNDGGKQIRRLLSKSRVDRVHQFALKVWRANPDFQKEVTSNDIIQFLSASYSETQQLGLELARKKFDPLHPDTELLIAMLDSPLEGARKQAESWFVTLRSFLLADASFVVLLLRMRSVQGHAWLRSLLATYPFRREQAEIIIARTVSFLMTLGPEFNEDKTYISQVADTIIISFGNHLGHLGLNVISDLLTSPLMELQAFAGKILMKHSLRPEDLPEDFLKVLLTSENPESRGLGISLLGRFPHQRLLEKKNVLVGFCLSPLADVRNAVRPLILSLTKAYPEFGDELVNLFVPAFLIKESYEGVHDDLLQLLSNELRPHLQVISKERSLFLLNSRYRSAQLMGEILLQETINRHDITVDELVRISRNPLQKVRQYAWDAFRADVEKIKSAKEQAILITDTDWDDTRIFAFEFLRETFTESEWSIDLLVTLCDSTRDDVQAFAREIITRFFKEEQGMHYLLKLSQHPSSNVQLFATTYLQQHATGKLDVLRSLELYFVTLLSQVSRGRAAKSRVFDFLRKESLRDEESARLISVIFSRVSVSVAIGEKAECISALRDIQKRFPQIRSSVVVKEVSDYVRH